jgi:hypothetical protein
MMFLEIGVEGLALCRVGQTNPMMLEMPEAARRRRRVCRVVCGG